MRIHTFHTGLRAATLFLGSAAVLLAQSEVSISEPPPPRYVGRFVTPFHVAPRIVPPVRLTDSPRLEALMRAGNLYLSAQDVIALVLENNFDIAVQRYGPFLAREVVRRTEGGGFLRAVDTPLIAPPSSPESFRQFVHFTKGVVQGRSHSYRGAPRDTFSRRCKDAVFLKENLLEPLRVRVTLHAFGAKGCSRAVHRSY